MVTRPDLVQLQLLVFGAVVGVVVLVALAAAYARRCRHPEFARRVDHDVSGRRSGEHCAGCGRSWVRGRRDVAELWSRSHL